jgi:hypothetical protein
LARADALLELPHGERRRTLIRELVGEWAQVDQGAALAWAYDLHGVVDSKHAIEEVLLRGSDVAGLAKQLASEEESLVDRSALGSVSPAVLGEFVMEYFRVAGAQETIGWVEANLDGLRRIEQRDSVIRSVASVDLEKAISLMENVNEFGVARTHEESVFKVMSIYAPMEAFEQLEKIAGVPKQGEYLLLGVWMFSRNPTEAIDRIGRIRSDSDAEAYANGLVHAMLSEADDNTLGYIADLENRLGSGVTEKFTEQFIEKDPSRAWRQLSAARGVGNLSDLSEKMLGSLVDHGNYVGASEVVMAFPGEIEGSRKIESLVGVWSRADIEEAKAWIEKLNRGVLKDRAIAAILPNIIERGEFDRMKEMVSDHDSKVVIQENVSE